MKLKNLLYLMMVTLSVLLFASCGGGGGSSDTELGSDLNNGFELQAITCNSAPAGTFSDSSSKTSVTIAANAATTCVNNTSNPTLEAATSLPSDFQSSLDDDTGAVNVTSGGAGYSFNINGDRGFVSAVADGVTISMTFDPTLIGAVADRTDSTMVFIRIYDPDEGTIATVTGTISGGTITAKLEGLPRTFTATVIYNPNVTAVAATTPASSISAGFTKAAKSTWTAQQWCTVFNWKSSALFDSLSVIFPSLTQTKTDMENKVRLTIADDAAADQTIYQAAGFKEPTLYVAKTAADPCGTALTTTPRYLIHIDSIGTHYAPVDPASTVTESKYGRINIQPQYITSTTGKAAGDTGSVKGIIAHELLHAVQASYGLSVTDSQYGYMEGTSTTYGMTIDQGGTITARSIETGETFKLSNFIMLDGYNTWPPYSNQDFFAYVGSKYNSGSLAYIADLFQKLEDDTIWESIGAATTFVPARKTLYGAMDSVFQAAFAGVTLKEIYLDFVSQRAIEHNTQSQLHPGEQVTSGALNTALFETGGIWNVSIDPLNVTSSSAIFIKVAPFAARAIRITASQAVGAGGTGATITVAPAIGTKFEGYAYQNGARTTLSSTNTFTNFGMTAADEIVILVAKIENDDTREDLHVAISGTNGTQGGGGGSSSTFTLDSFIAPGQTFDSKYVVVPIDAGIGVFIVSIMESTDLVEQAILAHIQFQFSTTNITGPGTYTVTGDNPDTGPIAVWYSSSIAAAMAGTGGTFGSTSGTLVLSSFGTAIGDHITGTVEVSWKSTDTTPDRLGSMSATFDFIVPSANAL